MRQWELLRRRVLTERGEEVSRQIYSDRANLWERKQMAFSQTMNSFLLFSIVGKYAKFDTSSLVLVRPNALPSPVESGGRSSNGSVLCIGVRVPPSGPHRSEMSQDLSYRNLHLFTWWSSETQPQMHHGTFGADRHIFMHRQGQNPMGWAQNCQSSRLVRFHEDRDPKWALLTLAKQEEILWVPLNNCSWRLSPGV